MILSGKCYPEMNHAKNGMVQKRAVLGNRRQYMIVARKAQDF
jgi:hypothetical protein